MQAPHGRTVAFLDRTEPIEARDRAHHVHEHVHHMQNALPIGADHAFRMQTAQEGAQMFILEGSFPRHARERTPADKGERAGDDVSEEEEELE